MLKTYLLSFILIPGILPVSINCEQNSKEDFSIIEAEVLTLINMHRRSIGKNDLEVNPLIREEATIHTKNMASGRIPLSHEGFDARADKLLDKLNGNSAAENVAWGHPTAKLVVKGWLDSKEHRKNIEGDYNLTGIGIARGKDGELYYTQIFISTLKKE